MGTQAVTPPAGFVLEGQQQNDKITPPPGFELEQAQEEQPKQGAIPQASFPRSWGEFKERLRGASNPGSFEGHPENTAGYVESGPLEAVRGLVDMRAGNLARGAHRMVSGAGATVQPFALPASMAVAGVPATAAGLAAGIAGRHYGEKGAKALGASDDQAALVGDVGGLATGGLAAKAPAIGRAAAPVVGKTASFLSDVVDPELTGIVSPRLAHAQRMLGKIGERLSSSRATFPSEVQGPRFPSGAFEATEGEYVDTPPVRAQRAAFAHAELNPRQLPTSGTVAREIPYRFKPGQIPAEDVNAPDANVLAARSGIRLTPRGLLKEAPQLPKGIPPRVTGRAEVIDDQAMWDTMRNDLETEGRSARAKESREFNDNNSMDVPKWKRQADAKAEILLRQAEEKAHQPVRYTTTKLPRPKVAQQPVKPTASNDLMSALERTIAAQRAKKR